MKINLVMCCGCVSVVLFACEVVGEEPPRQTICLGSELDCVQDLAGGVNVRTRVCRLSVKLQCDDGTTATVTGTGVLIDCGDGKKNKVLTAKHVVKGTNVPGFCNGNLGYEAIDIKAEFGYYHTGSPCAPNGGCGAIAETRKGTCVRSDPNCDVAVIKLDKAPATVVDAPLKLSADAEPNTTVDLYIPQHPLGDCMEVAEGKIDHYGAVNSCDVFVNISATQSSSGSPIVRKSDGRIVGVLYREQQDCPNVGVRLDKLKTIVPALCTAIGALGDEFALGQDGDSFCIVPVASEWGLLVMVLLAITVGTIVFRQTLEHRTQT